MSKINIRDFHNENEDGAPDIVGVSTFSSTAYFVPTKGTTAQRPSDHVEVGSIRFNTDTSNLEYYRGHTLGWSQFELIDPELGGGTGSNTGLGTRGIISGGNTGSVTNVIQYITISTLGNAQDFGDLIAAKGQVASCASRTRGLISGGTPSAVDTIQHVTIASTGNAIDAANLTNGRRAHTSFSNQTRGIVAAGGNDPSALATIDYVTISSLADAQDFGDLSETKGYVGSYASSTRGLIAGGQTPTRVNTIEYVTITTTSNTTDFGDLTVARRFLQGVGNSTRGIFGSGEGSSAGTNVIDFVTIATTGNATDFGDDIKIRLENSAACSSPTRGTWSGGYTSPTGSYNDIGYITIATTGNSVDFGDLLSAVNSCAGCSNGHGGL